MPATDTLILKCDGRVVDDIVTVFRESKVIVEASPLRHLDGQQVQEWVVLVGVVAQSSPRILDALSRFLTRNNLQSLKIGDMEIKNPRPEDVPMLMAAIRPTPDEPS